MTLALGIVILVIVAAVIFDFVNGFHDASNIVATMIASRSMTPEAALILAATCEFLGPFLFGTAVAKTIGKGIVDTTVVNDTWIIFAALAGAISWNLLTWKVGLPSSSSHALIGGLVGAAIAGAGVANVLWGGFGKIVLALVVSPIVGLVTGLLFMKFMVFLARGQRPRVSRYFMKGQLVSAVGLALSHGANDAQKSMGIITMVLVAYAARQGEMMAFVVPAWVIFFCALAMGLGTAFGGWSIIKTVGSGIYRLRPIHGFSAQSTSGLVILGAALMGFPVSTTHVVSSSIMGVGSAERYKAVRWGKAGEIIATWFITIPAAALIGAAVFGVITVVRGVM
jgi:PiT family inorganic phosphate transporter